MESIHTRGITSLDPALHVYLCRFLIKGVHNDEVFFLLFFSGQVQSVSVYINTLTIDYKVILRGIKNNSACFYKSDNCGRWHLPAIIFSELQTTIRVAAREVKCITDGHFLIQISHFSVQLRLQSVKTMS